MSIRSFSGIEDATPKKEDTKISSMNPAFRGKPSEAEGNSAEKITRQTVEAELQAFLAEHTGERDARAVARISRRHSLKSNPSASAVKSSLLGRSIFPRQSGFTRQNKHRVPGQAQGPVPTNRNPRLSKSTRNSPQLPSFPKSQTAVSCALRGEAELSLFGRVRSRSGWSGYQGCEVFPWH